MSTALLKRPTLKIVEDNNRNLWLEHTKWVV